MKPEKHLATEATENNRGHREKSLCYSYAVLSVNPDVTTDMTTSHLTNPAKDAGQVIGYSHSTKLANNASQVAGYVA
jgi:hypothetical protein